MKNFKGYLSEKKKEKDLNKDPRIRFNNGYHDGAFDAKNKTGNRWQNKSHFDKMYKQGYEMGYYDVLNDEYTSNSTKAWKNRVKFKKQVRI